MYEASGTIKVIFDEQVFPSGFNKREFVVTTENDRYPQDLKFELVKDKTKLIEPFEAGQKVVVNFDIRGNEYKDRYYVNLSAWKIQPADDSSPSGGGAAAAGTAGAAATGGEPAASDMRDEDDFDDDDVPF